MISTECLKQRVQTVLQDQFQQNWSEDMKNCNKCMLYKHYKTELCIEDYLLSLNTFNRKWIIKFRLCNHKLSIEKGRYSNIDRFRRYCDLCDSESLGDEYHLLMECKNEHVKKFRCKYLTPYVTNINMYTFCSIMKNVSTDKNLALKVSQFLFNVNNLCKCI